MEWMAELATAFEKVIGLGRRPTYIDDPRFHGGEHFATSIERLWSKGLASDIEGMRKSLRTIRYHHKGLNVQERALQEFAKGPQSTLSKQSSRTAIRFVFKWTNFLTSAQVKGKVLLREWNEILIERERRQQDEDELRAEIGMS
jgi:hypothetical protein